MNRAINMAVWEAVLGITAAVSWLWATETLKEWPWLVIWRSAMNPIIKRSIVLAGHKTSISLEDEF